jgi:hypothetical protein
VEEAAIPSDNPQVDREANWNGSIETIVGLVAYSEDELATFNKRTLVADVGFLEGHFYLTLLRFETEPLTR